MRTVEVERWWFREGKHRLRLPAPNAQSGQSGRWMELWVRLSEVDGNGEARFQGRQGAAALQPQRASNWMQPLLGFAAPDGLVGWASTAGNL